MVAPSIPKTIVQPVQETWTCNEQHALDKWESIEWARRICDRTNVVYLDTETTGLHGAYLVEIAVLSSHGSSLLNTLVKPPVPVEAGAERVHGITAEMLENAPTFPEIYLQLQKILSDRRVIIYNASFDCGILRNCCDYYQLPHIKFMPQCAMECYAQYFGEWSSYWGNYKWQKLPGGGHRARTDARACHKLVKRMAIAPSCEVKYERMFPPRQLFCEWKEVAKIQIGWKDKNNWYSLDNSRTFKIRLPKLRWKHD